MPPRFPILWLFTSISMTELRILNVLRMYYGSFSNDSCVHTVKAVVALPWVPEPQKLKLKNNESCGGEGERREKKKSGISFSLFFFSLLSPSPPQLSLFFNFNFCGSGTQGMVALEILRWRGLTFRHGG